MLYVIHKNNYKTIKYFYYSNPFSTQLGAHIPQYIPPAGEEKEARIWTLMTFN